MTNSKFMLNTKRPSDSGSWFGRVWGTQNQKKNKIPNNGRYFRAWRFRWYLRFGLKVLLFKVNSKILFFAKIILLLWQATKICFWCQKLPIWRQILRRFQICYQKRRNLSEYLVILKKHEIFCTVLRSFVTFYEVVEIQNKFYIWILRIQLHPETLFLWCMCSMAARYT